MREMIDSAPGPFAAPLNRALSDAFGGASLAGLSVHRDADAANQALGALATTHGSEIALSSSVREDATDPRSMNVIAHEVAHALAGAGSGETLVDQDGDPGERAADAAGEAFAHYADGGMRGAAPRLQPAHGGRAAIHRWEIQGPWDTNEPTHETLTAETLKAAGVLPGGADYTDANAWEYVRGAMWNDDPKSQLFDDSPDRDEETDNYSSGLEWTHEFDSSHTDATAGRQFGVGDSILSRSHFGDLQSLHSMASADKEDPEVTKQKIMMWAEFTTKVAEGQIGGSAPLSALALDNPDFKELIGNDPNLGQESVSELFGIQGKGDVKARATGSLLHMIQDSYAEGHVQRADLGDGRRGDIENFHSYVQQDETKHDASDDLPEGPGTVAEKVHTMPGGQDAIDQGAAVVKMIQAGVPPDKVVDYLSNTTYRTAKDISPAGPGDKFELTPEPPGPGFFGTIGNAITNSATAIGHGAEKLWDWLT